VPEYLYKERTMQNTTFAKRSLAIVLGFATSGFAMQACSSSDTTTSTTGETTTTTGAGGTGGRDTTTTSTGTSTSDTTSTTTSTASGTGGSGGAGGAGGTGSTSTAGTGTGSSTGTGTSTSTGSSSSTSTGSSSSTSTGSSSSSSTSTGSSSSTGSGSSTSTGGPAGCIELTAAAFKKSQADGDVALYQSTTSPNLGLVDADSIQIEFYGSGVDPSLNGENKGTFDLSSGIDNNYSTCARCIRVFEDPEVPGRIFYQKTGTLVIDATSDQLNGKISGTITNLTLVEVTINSSTYVSTPVVNGACVHIASAPISVTPPVVPANWMCDPTYYAEEVDNSCDCGCGAVDFDCLNNTSGACDFCDDPGSCSSEACPSSEINPANNGVCLP
jgi:hypothetical protein